MCILIFYKKKNKESIIAIGFMFAGILITLALNTLLKIIIQRPRPCESLIGEINILEDCGNAFSFFSAHSSSSFCMATFFLLYLKNRYYGFAAFLWAFMVAYSRLYVGKHYPLDVFIGTFFGITMGILCYFLFVHYGKPKLIDSKL
jgi:undecaprenyl-diphosphatase